MARPSKADLKHKKWSQIEKDKFTSMVEEHFSYDQIAIDMRRPLKSVKSHQVLLGIGQKSVGGTYFLEDIARIFGRTWQVVQRWIDSGELKAIQHGPRSPVYIDHDNVLEFVSNEKCWLDWTVDGITDDTIRDWAREKRGDIEYYTTSRLGELIGLTGEAVWKRINKGVQKALWVKGRGWLIRSDWVGIGSPITRRKPTPISDDDLAFLKEWRPFQPIAYLANAIERRWINTAKKCLQLGVDGPKIPNDRLMRMEYGRTATPSSKMYREGWLFDVEVAK